MCETVIYFSLVAILFLGLIYIVIMHKQPDEKEQEINQLNLMLKFQTKRVEENYEEILLLNTQIRRQKSKQSINHKNAKPKDNEIENLEK